MENSRRDFLKTSSLAAAGVYLSAMGLPAKSY
ncbi:MAG TPA: twin-arginine translocation signal domain-containing protein, partial [Chitinophaga sp.]